MGFSPVVRPFLLHGRQWHKRRIRREIQAFTAFHKQPVETNRMYLLA